MLRYMPQRISQGHVQKRKVGYFFVAHPLCWPKGLLVDSFCVELVGNSQKTKITCNIIAMIGIWKIASRCLNHTKWLGKLKTGTSDSSRTTHKSQNTFCSEKKNGMCLYLQPSTDLGTRIIVWPSNFIAESDCSVRLVFTLTFGFKATFNDYSSLLAVHVAHMTFTAQRSNKYRTIWAAWLLLLLL
jgi:hypothetical protein